MPANTSPAPAELDDTVATAEVLWRDFFERNQVTGGQTDGAGGCALLVDGLHGVARCWPDEGLLAVQLQVMALPKAPPARAALCEALLVQATDLIEGDVVGIDSASGTAVYQRLLGLEGLDAPALTAELWDMVDAVADLRARLPRSA